MKQLIFVVFLLFFVGLKVSAQAASIDQANKIEQLAGNVFKCSFELSAKKASSLLVDQIKSRQNSEITVNGEKLIVSYENKLYTFEGINYTKVSEVRKAVLIVIRKRLGIV